MLADIFIFKVQYQHIARSMSDYSALNGTAHYGQLRSDPASPEHGNFAFAYFRRVSEVRFINVRDAQRSHSLVPENCLSANAIQVMMCKFVIAHSPRDPKLRARHEFPQTDV